MSDTKTTKTIAEELREAAKTLREAAKNATRGPWIAHPTMGQNGGDMQTWTVGLPFCNGGAPDPCEAGCAGDVLTTGREGCEEDFLGEADATWIALTSPALAEPLASWLETAADWCDQTTVALTDPNHVLHHACGGVAGEDCSCFDHPLAVARVLNGTAT